MTTRELIDQLRAGPPGSYASVHGIGPAEFYPDLIADDRQRRAAADEIERLAAELARYRRAFHCPECGGRGWRRDWPSGRNVVCDCGAVELREQKHGG